MDTSQDEILCDKALLEKGTSSSVNFSQAENNILKKLLGEFKVDRQKILMVQRKYAQSGETTRELDQRIDSLSIKTYYIVNRENFW